MQSPLETEQVVLDNMVNWTSKLCDQTSLVPYSSEYRSKVRSWARLQAIVRFFPQTLRAGRNVYNYANQQ